MAKAKTNVSTDTQTASPAKSSRLKGVAPKDVIPTKPKFMISGPSGIGKTFFSMEFPKPYFIDTEGGASRKQYQDRLAKVGGSYMGKDKGSQDFAVVLDEIKALTTEKHDYKTLIIDSFSYLYMLESARAEQEVGSDFGRDKKEANKPTRQLIRALEKLDMTVIIICHTKEKWKRQGKELYSAGTTFDGYDKLEYLLDLWIEISDRNHFVVKKSRVETLPQDSEFELNYAKFADLYGKDVIEREAVPVVFATPEHVAQIKSLLEIVRVADDWAEKCFKKADVDDWAEMEDAYIVKLIKALEDKRAVNTTEVK